MASGFVKVSTYSSIITVLGRDIEIEQPLLTEHILFALLPDAEDSPVLPPCCTQRAKVSLAA